MAYLFDYSIYASLLDEQEEEYTGGVSIASDTMAVTETPLSDWDFLFSQEDNHVVQPEPTTGDPMSEEGILFGLSNEIMPRTESACPVEKLSTESIPFENSAQSFSNLYDDGSSGGASSGKTLVKKKKATRGKPYPTTEEEIDREKEKVAKKKQREYASSKQEHGLDQKDFVKTIDVGNDKLIVKYDLGESKRPFRSMEEFSIEYENKRRTEFKITKRKLIRVSPKSQGNQPIEDELHSNNGALAIGYSAFSAHVRAGTYSMLVSVDERTELSVKFFTKQTGSRNLLLIRMDVERVTLNNKEKVFLTKCTKNN